MYSRRRAFAGVSGSCASGTEQLRDPGAARADYRALPALAPNNLGEEDPKKKMQKEGDR